jgi:non-ribosomal peptide synthetase component F
MTAELTSPAVLLSENAGHSFDDTRVNRLQGFFEYTARRRPDVAAVEDGPMRLSYGQLNGRANQLAHHLRGYGCGEGAAIGILMHRSWRTYVALLGCSRLALRSCR